MTTDLGFAGLQTFMQKLSGNFQMFGDIRSDNVLLVNSNDFRRLLVDSGDVAELVRRYDADAC
jgi:hypothetical protein